MGKNKPFEQNFRRCFRSNFGVFCKKWRKIDSSGPGKWIWNRYQKTPNCICPSSESEKNIPFIIFIFCSLMLIPSIIKKLFFTFAWHSLSSPVLPSHSFGVSADLTFCLLYIYMVPSTSRTAACLPSTAPYGTASTAARPSPWNPWHLNGRRHIDVIERQPRRHRTAVVQRKVPGGVRQPRDPAGGGGREPHHHAPPERGGGEHGGVLQEGFREMKL